MLPYQSGIIADASSEALFITFNVNIGQDEQVRKVLKQVWPLINTIQQHYVEANLHAVIAIGSEYWSQLSAQKPKLLKNFDAYDGKYPMPSTPVDFLLHIRSERRDVNYILARQITDLLSNAVSLVEEISGFRYLESRDLTGFVDGTENPQGEHRKLVALVGTEDPNFADGSYLHVQRFVHNLPYWQSQSIPQQEDIFGRTKERNEEYSSNRKATFAHTKRTSLKDAQGMSMEILRHSIPYASLSEAGLMFASYCKTPEHFNAMLKSMVNGDEHGTTDKLMDFTRAVTGQAFFAPSTNWFNQL